MKRSRSPRWLFLGALAVSTSITTSITGRALAQELELAKPALAALMDETWMGRLAPVQTAGMPALRFDIPPGPLGAALNAFESAAGVRVEIEDEAIHGLDSPGVSGLLTPDQAIAGLLEGTGVDHQFTDARTVRLGLRLSETVDVIAQVSPSSPKYLEPLRDIPQTVTVIPQAMIEEQGATTLRDVLRNVTGISIQAGEGGGGLPGDNLTIRGFAARNDIFVDGVRDFGSYTRDPFNIEQVEVAKGPASLYAGRGSTGGSLNLASKTPNLGTAHSATFGAGTGDLGRATLDVNQPIEGIDGAAFRANLMWTHSDTPGRDSVESQRWGVAPSMAFGLGTPTRVTLSYSHLDQDNMPDYGLPWVPATNIPLAEHADKPAPVDFDNFYGLTDRDYEKTVTQLATAELERDLGDSVTLRSLARYGQSERDSIVTSPRFAGNDSTAINRQLQSRDLEDTITILQNDLTATFDTGKIGHALVAGIEIARETSESFARTGPAAPQADLFDPDPRAPYAGPITRTGARTEGTADTGAVYASDTIKLGESWQLTGGLRWDRFGMKFDSVDIAGVTTPFERTDEMLSWRAGAVYKPRPNGSIYVGAGTSFNPSAEAATGLNLSASTVELEPEKSRGYELGTKWDLLGSRLSLSAAAFRTEKTNARTPGILPGDLPTVLQGEQRVEGMELGVSGALNSRWQAFLGYTWMASEVLKSNTPAEVGRELANTPEHSASLWTTYRLRSNVEVGGGAQYVGDRFNNNTGTRVAPDYLLFDAMAAYDLSERFTLRLNVSNLAGERYIDRVGGGHFVPGAGRSVALTTALRF
ncbi:MAG: catecholate siderophore receptor [Acidobacteriota bacterium]|jgi:catecholate siderophore receptor|nr:catecholate siderophore receptor [Acidobacteriota bacterium]